MKYKGEYSPSYLADPVSKIHGINRGKTSEVNLGNLHMASAGRLYPTT